MTTNDPKQAAGVSNSYRQYFATNSVNFPTDRAISQAPEGLAMAALSIPPSPQKATILAALRVLFDPAGVFNVQSLTIKKSNKAALEGTTE